MKLSVGDTAPDFTAPDQNGESYSLRDFKGKWILLYFYPKDFTSGCTREACSMRDHFEELSKSITIFGVSADSIDSHKKFALAYHLPFTVLADPEKKLIKAYGADGFLFTRRSSFLIDPEGKIAKIYDKVDPDIHATQVLSDLTSFTQ